MIAILGYFHLPYYGFENYFRRYVPSSLFNSSRYGNLNLWKEIELAEGLDIEVLIRVRHKLK